MAPDQLLCFQEEYDELLKYAVVVPKCDPSKMPQTLTTIRGALENASEEGIITIKARPQKGLFSIFLPLLISYLKLW